MTTFSIDNPMIHVVGMTLANRIAAAMKARGMNQNQLAVATGLTPGYLNKVQTRNSDSMKVENARLIAGALAISVSWLLTGEGDPPVGLPEPTPHTPPARSEMRERERPVADHWFPDEVEALFIAAVRRRADVDYSVPVSRVAKVFVRDANHQLKAGVTRLDLMLLALDIARDLEGRGVEPTPDAIHGEMLSRAVEQSRPRPGESALDRVLREADALNQREGIVPDVSAIPRVTPSSRTDLPRVELPPAPPPASGPVRRGRKGAR